MKTCRTIGYVIPVATALLLSAAIWRGSASLAIGIIAAATAVSFIYADWLKKRGEVISDERTLRIEEMASRRTLQVLVLVLALSVVLLSILSAGESRLKSAYYLALGLMVLTSILKLGMKHYYSRVM